MEFGRHGVHVVSLVTPELESEQGHAKEDYAMVLTEISNLATKYLVVCIMNSYLFGQFHLSALLQRRFATGHWNLVSMG